MLHLPALALISVLAAVGLLAAAALVRAPFRHPGFGRSHFRSEPLWHLGGIVASIPRIGFALGALVALLLVFPRAPAGLVRLGAGLLVGFGLEACAYYLALSGEEQGGRTGLLGGIGGLLAAAAGLFVLLRLVGPRPSASERPLGLFTRLSLLIGAALTLAGALIEFNGGGTTTDAFAGSLIEKHAFERFALFGALVLVVLVALFPRTLLPARFAAGVLIGCGASAALLYLRFLLIPAFERPELASVAPGGPIGLIGGLFVLFAGLAARRGAETEVVAPLRTARA
jgi:hypothetical protein